MTAAARIGRFTERELKAVAALHIAVGEVGANALRRFRIGRGRARAIERIVQEGLSDEEWQKVIEWGSPAQPERTR